jgi:hypothetical protein
MRGIASVRALAVALALLTALPVKFSHAVDDATPYAQKSASASNIVIGFVGGFVGHDNQHHGPVRLAQKIRPEFAKDTYVRIFENRRRKRAYQTIMRLLDANRDGFLSADEKAHARIVLFGQSWGASAAVLLARDLRRQGIPVLLTVQVDSVAKLWQQDSIIPDNVAAAVNFYQPNGLIHGRSQIKAADPSKTDILGNFLIDYKKNPVQCPQASWFDRVFTPDHMQSECDSRLWSQIETLIRQRLSPRDASATASATSPDSQPDSVRLSTTHPE